jgi:hypothetical protein
MLIIVTCELRKLHYRLSLKTFKFIVNPLHFTESLSLVVFSENTLKMRQLDLYIGSLLLGPSLDFIGAQARQSVIVRTLYLPVGD